MDSNDSVCVILVTGGGTGIGRATARAFADAGDRVVVVGRRAGALAGTGEGHTGIHPLVGDLNAPGGPGGRPQPASGVTAGCPAHQAAADDSRAACRKALTAWGSTAGATVTTSTAGQPLIPQPAATVTALRQAVAQISPAAMPAFTREPDHAADQARQACDMAPLQRFIAPWAAYVYIERQPGLAAELTGTGSTTQDHAPSRRPSPLTPHPGPWPG